MIKSSVLLLCVFVLTGCMGREYRMQQLQNANQNDLCYAATDTRFFAKTKKQVANEIIQARGLTCDWAAYGMIHSQQGIAAQQRYQKMMQPASQPNYSGTTQNSGSKYNTGGGTASGPAFKTGEFTRGMNKICNYDRMGSPVSNTVGATDLCPLTLP